MRILQKFKATLLITIFSLFFGYGQDTIDIKEIYINDGLAYKVANDRIFTGVAQKTRKNGHVVFEEFYDNGKILSDITYFNFREKEPSSETIYHVSEKFVPQKRIKYLSNKHGKWQEIIHYDHKGEKVLEETLKEGKITYKCEYLNGKKHGSEFCFDEDGNELIFQYENGKKIKDELP